MTEALERNRSRGWRRILGPPRDVADPQLFRSLSLVAFLAWVGLGADGLSSSAYGPEEAFKALGTHVYLAPILVLMTAVTIAVISLSYSDAIAHFPGGGGGYLVASKLLGRHAGVVSGSALLVDYVLTITISIASATDQLWSLLPLDVQSYKPAGALAGIGLLMLLNLRGVKESVKVLVPVFLLFVVTHTVMILYALAMHARNVPGVVAHTRSELDASVGTLGWWPVVALLLRAYSLGGGTYTGIEAVSNGVGTLREPRVRTGRRTMALMAFSLAFTAGGILVGYLLTGIRPAEGKTMNAVLFDELFGALSLGGVPWGGGFVAISMIASAALLVVAAQAGFLDGPRTLGNMSLDSWMPHRFAHLSDRFVVQNGVVLMALLAAAALLYTGGSVAKLVVMYSINVFITFSLTMFGMATHWLKERRRDLPWRRKFSMHAIGVALCAVILVTTTIEKFHAGGWVTLLITSLVIAGCYWVKRHYNESRRHLRRLDTIVAASAGRAVPSDAPAPLDPAAPTAIVCVEEFSGFGLHLVLTLHKLFPKFFVNFLFVSAAVVDSGAFKGENEIDRLRADTEDHLRRYVEWARAHGLRADSRAVVGTEPAAAIEELCQRLAVEFPRCVVFVGKLVFRQERWYHRLLHNETAYAIQRRLLFCGVPTMTLSVRVFES